MARPITWRMAQALKDGAPLAVLAIVDHPDAVVYFWTGIGTLEYGGHAFVGLGRMVKIAPVGQISALQIQELEISFSGIPAERATWLSDNIRNRSATASLAALDQRGRVVPDPIPIVDALLDYQEFKLDDDGSASITLNAQTGFYTLERAVDEVWSTEDQQTRFPTDVGLDLVYTLQTKQVKWTIT